VLGARDFRLGHGDLQHGSFATIAPARLRKVKSDGFRLCPEADAIARQEVREKNEGKRVEGEGRQEEEREEERERGQEERRQVNSANIDQFLVDLDPNCFPNHRVPLDVAYDPKVTIRGLFNDNRFSFQHFIDSIEVSHGDGPNLTLGSPYVMRLPRGTILHEGPNRHQWLGVYPSEWSEFAAKAKVIESFLHDERTARGIRADRQAVVHEDSGKRWIRFLLSDRCIFVENGLETNHTFETAYAKWNHKTIFQVDAQLVGCWYHLIVWSARRVAWSSSS